MASTRTVKTTEPILLNFEWKATSPEAAEKAIVALKTTTDYQLAHCPGVETYAFRRVDETTLRMTELYRDTEVYWKHIPSGSVVEAKLQCLFDDANRASARGAVVGSFLSEGVLASVSFIRGEAVPVISGFLMRPAESTAATLDGLSPACIFVDIKGGFANDDSRSFVQKTLEPLMATAANVHHFRTCALFPCNDDMHLIIVSSVASAACTVMANNRKSILEPLYRRFGATNVQIEAFGDIDEEASQILSKVNIVATTHDLIAGFVIHPMILARISGAPPPTPDRITASSRPNSKAQAEVEDAQKKALDEARKVHDGPFAIKEPPSIPLFELIYDPYTGEPRTIKFSPNAPGRSAHKYAGAGARADASPDGVLEVPLLFLVRKLSGQGSADIELSIDLLFGLLERLRSWQRNLVLMNKLLARNTTTNITTDNSNNSSSNVPLTEEEHYFVECLGDNLQSFGYPPRAKDVRVNVEGLDALINTIEWAMRDTIEPARESLASTRQVSYRGLMEAFHIGSIVVGQAGGLAGAPVAYRVVDCYMSTQRSTFGGAKFVFTLGLEFVANFGQHFCVCSFEEKVEEFEGERDLVTLPIVPLQHGTHQEEMFQKRGKTVADLGVNPVYRAYSSGSFFAHRSARDGAQTAGLHQAGAGRAMIDNERGLMLGHAPGASYDGPGISITSALKVYRIAVRASGENESEAAKQERIKNAQLKLFKYLPKHFETFTWPAVVAYSFTWKTWGHVLTSGLSEVEFSDEPWEQLVLPARTKELLFASARYNLSGAPGVSDVIKGKSQGALYLLYGAPGTGKTLTVEAIAEKFKLPLYTVSLGELGTSAQEVDAAINNILALCAQWKAVVLLDEGDALLEQREKGHLQLNSLTGVLLRSLENFDGQLFITSNRLQHIDRAVLSRVTLALKYDALNADSRAILWQNILKRAKVDLANIDVQTLAKYEISGRELLHIVKLALALAYHREVPVNQEILVSALEESIEFRSHFPDNQW